VEASNHFLGVDSCIKQRKVLMISYKCMDVAKPFSMVNPNIKVGLLFIEPRKLETISPAIETVLMHVPDDWEPLYVFHAPEHKDADQAKWIKSLPFVNLAKSLNKDVYFLPIEDKYYQKSQNVLGLDINWWRKFSEDYLFLFHYDSAMCSPQDKPYPIEFYLNFDYVGAPWEGLSFEGMTVWSGNGGFSLRNVSLTKYCLENSEKLDGIKPNEPEDCYYAYCAQRFGRPAPYELSKYFAIETVDSPTSIGIHGLCTNYRKFGCNKDWVDKWLSVCPDSEFLFTNDGRCTDCMAYDWFGLPL